jgi:hypothetical protein
MVGSQMNADELGKIWKVVVAYSRYYPVFCLKRLKDNQCPKRDSKLSPAEYKPSALHIQNVNMPTDTNSPDVGSSDISSDMKHRTVDG